MNGRAEMKGITIDPSLLQASEKEMLEDLIVAATKDAQDKAADAAKTRWPMSPPACRSAGIRLGRHEDVRPERHEALRRPAGPPRLHART